MTRSIKIEDISVDIPVSIDSRFSKATKRTIFGGLLTRPLTENIGTISIDLGSLTSAEELKIRELVRNYAFINTNLSGISGVWDARFIIDSLKSDYVWYDRVSTLTGTLQLYPYWNYIITSMERPLHDRWKYLLMEDFDTDGSWPTDAPITVEIDSDG